MKHAVDGRKLGRNTSHRKAMFRNMANSVITQEQIVTTVQKAKEVRRVVDRLVTLGKNNTPASHRLAFDRTRDNLVVKKLFTELAKRYAQRAGGYTRVLRLSDLRWGDAAEMAILEMVDHPVLNRKRQPKAAGSEPQKLDDKDDTTTARDPFKGFRKMLGGGGKSKAPEGGGKASKAGKGSKAASGVRKTPTATGSNKAGGSS